MIETPAILWANLILGSAALVSSITGFGFAVIASPLMLLILPPAVAVPVVVLSWLPLAVLLAVRTFKDMSLSRIGLLYACALPAVPLGVYVLARADAGTMRLVIGALSIAAAVTLAVRPGRPWRRRRVAACGAGLVSGLMGGASGISGPPVVLLGIKQQWARSGMRADLIGYFLILHLSMVAIYRGTGLMQSGAILLSLVSLPGIVLGYLIGDRLHDTLPERSYRVLALVVVSIGGVLAILLR